LDRKHAGKAADPPKRGRLDFLSLLGERGFLRLALGVSWFVADRPPGVLR
jgi:hypothetical protein